MQKVVYTCDHCEEVIGAKPHVSLRIAGMGNESGIALPPKTPGNPTTSWHVSGLKNGFIHLHSKCASPYFNAAVKSKTTPEKKR